MLRAPERAITYYSLGCALQEQGKILEAMQCYREALTVNPFHIESNYNLANALHEVDDLNEAEQLQCHAIYYKSLNYCMCLPFQQFKIFDCCRVV